MNQSKVIEFLVQNITSLEGVGNKTKNLLKKKKIEKVSDLLWNLPQSFTDRSNIKTLDQLEIGKITTIKIKVIKYNFPRIRNLPNKVICEDGIRRMGRIPGKLRRRMWVRENDLLIVVPWSFQDSKADVKFRYTPTQTANLKRRGKIPDILDIY